MLKRNTEEKSNLILKKYINTFQNIYYRLIEQKG